MDFKSFACIFHSVVVEHVRSRYGAGAHLHIQYSRFNCSPGACFVFESVCVSLNSLLIFSPNFSNVARTSSFALFSSHISCVPQGPVSTLYAAVLSHTWQNIADGLTSIRAENIHCLQLSLFLCLLNKGCLLQVEHKPRRCEVIFKS